MSRLQVGDVVLSVRMIELVRLDGPQPVIAGERNPTAPLKRILGARRTAARAAEQIGDGDI
jgi:hypothetical protein